MLGSALTYPRAGEYPIRRIGVGGLLVLFGVGLAVGPLIDLSASSAPTLSVALSVLPVLGVVPLLVLVGYLLRVLASGFAGEEAPPSFAAWGSLLIDGVRAVTLVFAFTLLPSIVLFAAALVGGEDGGGSNVLGAIVLLAAMCSYAAAAYLAPIGLVTLARTDRMGDALDRRVLVSVARSRPYVHGWRLAVIVVLVGAILAGMLGPVLVGAFVLFYATVAAAYLCGRAVAAASDVDAPVTGVRG